MKIKKNLGLSDFFTYEYQARLIHDAQMLGHNYENALIEYWKIFTANLIKCFEVDRLKGSSTSLYRYVENVLDSVKKEEFQRKIIFDDQLLGVSEKVSIITEMFLLIREVYYHWTSCDLSASIKVLDHILSNKLKISNIPGYILPETSILYRGRVSETQLDKADMFHIPFMQAYKIRNQRFSITGQPLLYLTDSISGIFNELSIRSRDEYENLYIAQYRLKSDEAAWFDRIFDMTINGKDLEHAIDYELFNSYFCKFLLSCVCSFPNVKGRNKSYFVEEYVIPQLVTQLLKKLDFKGICYNTINNNWHDECSNQNKDYINYAFFTQKENVDNSIDIKLRNRFIIDSFIKVLEVDDYRSLSDYSLHGIINMIEEHFDRINGLLSIMNQIEGSSYSKYYNKEKDYFFKDGKYCYIEIELGDNNK